MTLGELIDSVQSLGAAFSKAVGLSNDDEPQYAVIVCCGSETTKDVLAAIEELEAKWDASP